MSEESSTFTRVNQRESGKKVFNIPSSQLKGYSTVEKYKENKDYQQAQEMQRSCMILAQSYASIMVKRITSEQPEFFETTSHDEASFKTHLANNFCIRETQNQAVAFRHAHADMIEDSYTKDSMRRMINGGDKFHPYM